MKLNYKWLFNYPKYNKENPALWDLEREMWWSNFNIMITLPCSIIALIIIYFL